MSIDAKDGVPFEQSRSELIGLTDAAHRLLLDDVMRGLADIAAGRTEDADTAIERLQHQLVHRPQRRRRWLHGITIRELVILGVQTWQAPPR
jgi:hypothetical protein